MNSNRPTPTTIRTDTKTPTRLRLGADCRWRRSLGDRADLVLAVEPERPGGKTAGRKRRQLLLVPAQPFGDLRLGELAAFEPELTALPERDVQQGAAAKLLQIRHLRPGIGSLSPRGRPPAGEKELRLDHDREQERQPDRDPAADRIRKLEVDDHDRDDAGTQPPDGPDSAHLDTNVTARRHVPAQ